MIIRLIGDARKILSPYEEEEANPLPLFYCIRRDLLCARDARGAHKRERDDSKDLSSHQPDALKTKG